MVIGLSAHLPDPVSAVSVHADVYRDADAPDVPRQPMYSAALLTGWHGPAVPESLADQRHCPEDALRRHVAGRAVSHVMANSIAPAILRQAAVRRVRQARCLGR